MDSRLISLFCHRFVWASLLWLLGALAPGHTSAQEIVRLIPEEFTLTGSAARQSLVLETFSAQNAIGQIGDNVSYTSSDPAIVKIEEGVAIPLANGKATITATAGDRKATTAVTVTEMDKPFQWNFRNHIESVLSKAGCNSGACHGALAGKKGFKLSLGAYDPVADYFSITRQARARRVVLSDPGRSLVLTKPSGCLLYTSPSPRDS